MELNEAVHRVFRQHWWIIVLAVAVCASAAALLHQADKPTYTASARLVLDTQDPDSSTGSTVIGDTVKAIATSPVEVAAALSRAHVVGQSPTDVAKNVSVSPLGTSGVIQLSVTDTVRSYARALANVLAKQVIDTRSAVNGRRIKQISADLDGRISDLNQRIAGADAAIDRYNRQLAFGPTGAAAGRLRAQIDSETRLRDFDAEQRGVLVSERLGLLSTDALRPQASIISKAAVPAHADPSRKVPDIMLGLLLGLVLGIGAAALIETFKPTLHGPDMLAREFGTAYLGTIPKNAGDAEADLGAEPITRVLRLAAERAGVMSVSLLAAVPDPGLSAAAANLEAAVNGAAQPPPDPTERIATGAAQQYVPRRREKYGPAEPSPSALRVRTFGIDSPASRNGIPSGVVLVAPRSLRRSRVLEVKHLLSVLPVPVLGLITYGSGSRWMTEPS
jgi:capsular polysaccharide biosynthesis protein